MKKLLIMCMICSIGFSISSEVEASESQSPNIISTYENSDNEVVIKASDIIWKFKLINGVLHKRKYNRVTGQWIGNWIKA